MTYQDNDNTKLENANFSALLGWLAAAAILIASIASAVANH